MRAVADNSDLAASSGIHVERVHGSTAFLSAGIAGLGGALLAAILPINPELGLMLLLPAFAVIVLGTIGSIPGVIIGALIVGLLRSASEPVLIGAGNALDRPTASGFAEVMPFVFLVGLLLLAPRGIGFAIGNWNIERIRKKRLGQQNRNPSPIREVFGPLGHLPEIMTLGAAYFDRINELKDKTMDVENVVGYFNQNFCKPKSNLAEMDERITFVTKPVIHKLSQHKSLPGTTKSFSLLLDPAKAGVSFRRCFCKLRRLGHKTSSSR